MAVTVFGIFKNEIDAEAAIKKLEALNYSPKDLSVVMKDVKKTEGDNPTAVESLSKGALAGAVAGGAAVGLAGLLVGIGAVTIPGIGGLLVAGPVATAFGLTGAAAATTTGAVTGLVAGGFVGALVNLGFSQSEAQQYEEEIRGGGILLAVPTRDMRTAEVRKILEDHNASGVRQLELPAKA
ncbi:MAG: low temperature-induced protein [Patescibacteria group bacterium]